MVDDLKLSDFEYDTTAKDYTSDYHSKNAIENAAIIIDMYDPYKVYNLLNNGEIEESNVDKNVEI